MLGINYTISGDRKIIRSHGCGMGLLHCYRFQPHSLQYQRSEEPYATTLYDLSPSHPGRH